MILSHRMSLLSVPLILFIVANCLDFAVSFINFLKCCLDLSSHSIVFILIGYRLFKVLIIFLPQLWGSIRFCFFMICHFRIFKAFNLLFKIHQKIIQLMLLMNNHGIITKVMG